MDQYSLRPPQRMGTSAILAVLASLGSMFFSCSGRPLWGLILAALSIPFGLIGFLRAPCAHCKSPSALPRPPHPALRLSFVLPRSHPSLRLYPALPSPSPRPPTLTYSPIIVMGPTSFH